MKVFHDERGKITKVTELVTKGCLYVSEYTDEGEVVKTYAPKDIVHWETSDLNNINWDDYEIMD